eukprot:TRINITY_DN44706_c0_g1_i1.p2 TRINITY_DN44706_c0_g1~~TRINITY_DN44706_c0_g1_i1.p2  ORF type:complete len:151 (+),score=15.50 TRINITY_DN44706_c0_g1_i1:83-535(+)
MQRGFMDRMRRASLLDGSNDDHFEGSDSTVEPSESRPTSLVFETVALDGEHRSPKRIRSDPRQTRLQSLAMQVHERRADAARQRYPGFFTCVNGCANVRFLFCSLRFQARGVVAGVLASGMFGKPRLHTTPFASARQAQGSRIAMKSMWN